MELEAMEFTMNWQPVSWFFMRYGQLNQAWHCVDKLVKNHGGRIENEWKGSNMKQQAPARLLVLVAPTFSGNPWTSSIKSVWYSQVRAVEFAFSFQVLLDHSTSFNLVCPSWQNGPIHKGQLVLFQNLRQDEDAPGVSFWQLVTAPDPFVVGNNDCCEGQ